MLLPATHACTTNFKAFSAALHGKQISVAFVITFVTMLQWDSSWMMSTELRKKLLRQEAKRRTTAAANNTLRAIKAHSSKRVCSGDKYGEVVLPPGVLQQVMACLAAIEPDGVRGPAVAAADLANAALVSSSGAHCMGPRTGHSCYTCSGPVLTEHAPAKAP
jgi:hypothetical protein